MLAGELLTEISLGREVEKHDTTESPELKADPESVVRRIPIPEDDQLTEAVRILRLRLVEPVRALAEAERIAGELANAPGVRIRFTDPDEHTEVEPLSRRDAGDPAVAEELDGLLERLPRIIDPPTSTEA